jgi:site-specific DNA recombinase
MRLDGYVRVSRISGRSGDSFISPDQQRDKITQWAALRGVEITAWQEDLDQSGGKLSRPGFDRALQRVQAGKTGGIAVARLDRFSRAGVADALKLIESIEAAGGQVASVEEGVDPTTPFGGFARTLFLALAHMQREQVKQSWNDAQRRAVERGVHISSMAPTGYDRGPDGRLVPNAHAPHITAIYEMRVEGASWRELSVYLRDHGVRSPYGHDDWMPRAVAHIVENRVYTGEARSGEHVHPNAHPALVDEDLWHAAQQVKGEKAPVNLGRALFAGVLRCAGCGYTMKPDGMYQRGVRRRLYRCRTHRSSGRCPAPATILESVVEPLVTDTLMRGVGGMRATGTALTDELRAAERAADHADRELTTFLSAVSAADVGAEAFAAGAWQRRAETERAHDVLDQVRVRAGVADLPRETELRATWPSLTVEERNRVLRAAFDGVVLGRGRVPVEDKATIYWRGEAPDGLLHGRGR